MSFQEVNIIAEIKTRNKGELKTKGTTHKGQRDNPLIQKAVRADTINRIHQSINPREADGNHRADDGSSAAPVERVEQAATFTSEHAIAVMERGKRLAAAKSLEKKRAQAAEQAHALEAPAIRTATPTAPNTTDRSPHIRTTASQMPTTPAPSAATHTLTPTEQAKRKVAAKNMWDKKQKQATEQTRAQGTVTIQSTTPAAPGRADIPPHIRPSAPQGPAPIQAPTAAHTTTPADQVKRTAAAKELWKKKQEQARVKHTSTPDSSYTPDISAQAPKGIQSQSAGTKRPAIRERGKGNIPIKEKSRSHATIKTRPDPARSTSMRLAPGIKERGKTLAITNARKRQKRAQEAGRQLLVQQTKKAAQIAALTSRKIVEASARAVKAVISALVSFLGGGVVLAAACLIFLVAAIVASPFGILFSDEVKGPDIVSLAAAMGEINAEYNARLEELQDGYDTVNIEGRAASWRDVIAVFAVKTTDGSDGMDVITMDAERVQRLRTVFWDMTTITTSEDDREPEDTIPDDNPDADPPERSITITITAYTAAEMAERYEFTRYQKEAMEALMDALEEMGLFIGDLEISDATAIEVWNNLPAGLSNERRTVIQYALSLVGKVQYFWGGKSLTLGWNPLWGKSMQVWAEGSPTTGTYRPYGMDCSGFVDWAFYNQSGGSYVIGRGGGVIAQHNNCRSITWSEAIPGDLVFYPDDSHIGIVCGWDANGNILIVHCASGSLNGVVITGKSGFTTIGRPYYFNE